MSVFSKNSKKKLALTLACASVLGGKAQAINSGVKDVKSEQTIGALGGARNQPKKINWHKIAKIGGFSIAGLAVLETIHSIVGGVTDSKAGSYSIGRAIRNRVKKNNQLDSEEQKKLNSGNKLGDENDEDDNKSAFNELNKDNEGEKNNENLKQSITLDQEMDDKKNIIVDGCYEINLNERLNDKGNKIGDILISGKVISKNIGQGEKDIEKCNIGLIDKFDKFCFNKKITNKNGALKDYILMIFENFKKIDKNKYGEFFDEFCNICTNKRRIHELRVIGILKSKRMQFLIDDNNGYEITSLKNEEIRISGINNYLDFDFKLRDDDKKDEDNEKENEDDEKEDSEEESGDFSGDEI